MNTVVDDGYWELFGCSMFFCINETQIQQNMSASFHQGVAVSIAVGGKEGEKKKERVIKPN